MTDNTLRARLERCKALQGKVEAGNTLYSPRGLDFSQDDAKPIRGGQVLKSPEFVRLEALEDAANQLRIMGDVGGMEIVLALIDNPAPEQEEQPSPEPVECDDSDFHPASSDNDVIYMGKRAYVATDTDVNALQAEAWDEGWKQGTRVTSVGDENPYRKGDE